MTDRQMIARLRKLVEAFERHATNGCADYEPSAGCWECRHARERTYECARLTELKRRARELGVRPID